MTEALPLVLVPGLLCDAALWAHQIEHLENIAECTVGDTRHDDSIAAMAARILQGAPETFALAGLSMGGYICFEIMRQAPERVAKLALLDTAAQPDDEERRRHRAELMKLAEIGEFKGVAPRLLPQFIHPERLTDGTLTDAIMDMTQRVGRDAFLQQQQAIMGRVDSRPTLATIRVPTLVVCGREDILTPLARAEEIADGIAGARLCIVEECGHMSTMERPQAVTVLLRDWLLYDR
jgi:pimeloyl-ACP methyl ester carboxylesterase